MSIPGGVRNVWDPETQEVHGGQTWRQCEKFVEDFSVTTNPLGTPASGMDAISKALPDIIHYPAADNDEALEALSTFMKYPKDQLLIGNGASEFIDLVMRVAPDGKYKPGPFIASYMEYNRAAKASGRDILDRDSSEDAAVTVIIHPNSPTGDCLSLDDIEGVLSRTKGLIVLDESFIANYGPNWHTVSGLRLIAKYPKKLLVLNSWTKLWACPGLRLGSIACGPEWYRQMKKLQTPWSCSTLAQAFCAAAAKDTDYMNRTWKLVPEWKARHENLIRELGWTLHEGCPAWVPYIFLDAGSTEIAEKAAAIAQKVGCPVRWCASFGCPQHLRLGVRAPEKQDVLHAAWIKEFC